MKEQERFVNLLSSINRSGADIEGLLKYLGESSFYTAPASTKYHNSFKGGLVQHSLNVYDILVDLTEQYCPDKYSEDTLKIVALLHDISKADYYTEEIKNRKNYTENGLKYDSLGKFNWESYTSYTVKDSNNRTLFGTLEENSYYLISQFIPLTLEEASSILNHKGNVEGTASSANRDLLPLFNKYPLLVLLHVADFIASYMVESNE